MKEDIKAEWLARLRDPATPQGQKRLRWATGEMCCMGVLCEVLTDRGFLKRHRSDTGYQLVDEPDTDVFFCAYPTDDVLDYCEIPREIRGSDSTVQFLATMNDSGSNFAAIASTIEELL